MKTRTILLAVLALSAAFAVSAEPKKNIQFSPISCVRSGELPLLQVGLETKGELRAYFRRINTTDWCSVEGVNDGPMSRVVLPKFDSGDEIEYFMVLLEGRQVVARSPRIYRAQVTNDCQSASARHIVQLSMSCGQEAQGIPSAMGAGMAMSENIVRGNPPPGSPDRPGRRP